MRLRCRTSSFIFLLLSLFHHCFSTVICKPKELEKSRWIVPAKSSNDLDLYVHRGLEYNPSRAFSDILLLLNLTDSDTYDLYKGDNCSVVENDYLADNRMFGLLKGVNLWKSHYLNVFNDTVVGVVTQLPYSVQAKVLNVNYIRFGAFVAGILLFLFARSLARNALFFYGTGCSFGLLASLLIIVFVLYRFAPKKLIGLPILVGGWSLAMYMLHFAWKNFASLAAQYQKYFVAYVATVTLISLAVCYKKGPPKDARSLDLAQWAMQAVALLLIYASSQVQEVSVGVIALLLLHQFTRSWLGSFLRGIGAVVGYFWRKLFPPRRRLLTREEYEKEGRETTKRELEKLRQYCRSPDADVWKITSKVNDPRRFARFIDGKEQHVLEEEEEMYESDAEYLDRDEEEDDDDIGEDSDSHNQRSRQYSSQQYHDEDDGGDWEEEVVIRRTPRNRPENVVVFKKSSSKRPDLSTPNGSKWKEYTPRANTSYYRDSPRSQNSSRYTSPMSANKRYQKGLMRDRDDIEYESPFGRKNRKQESKPVQKRVESASEFLSSDSDQDLREEDFYPRGKFDYERD
ncbi:unnamed protein product [Cylicocyclus nassatus]|uniref:Nuclear envelope integral membrane protein 1 n=1 Tax=Cylicocyclus nassatus TaxID=53992 RepID=A0AA36M3J1_CYLNA|nr:unnamed protein product [Cylicocyclus nassatus]